MEEAENSDSRPSSRQIASSRTLASRTKIIVINRDADSSESDESQNFSQNGYYPSFLKIISNSDASRAYENQRNQNVSISEPYPIMSSTDKEDSKSYKIDIKEKETHSTDSPSNNNNNSFANGVTVTDIREWRFRKVERRESAVRKDGSDIKLEEVVV